jgi:hypothetical protein
MRTGSWRGGAIAAAADEPSDDWVAWSVLDRILVNGSNNIMTLINPGTWQGKQNHIVYAVGVVTLVNDANKTVVSQAIIDGTITGGGAISFIDEDNYALQVQEGGTVSGGKEGPATVIKAGGDRDIDDVGRGVYIYPGESLTAAAITGGPINGTFSQIIRLIHEG